MWMAEMFDRRLEIIGRPGHSRQAVGGKGVRTAHVRQATATVSGLEYQGAISDVVECHNFISQ